jgi:glycogen debranching enzyme
MRTIASEIEALELELNLMEPAVDTAKRRVSGEDEEWEKRKRTMLENMCSLVLQFKMEDPPHKAVAILSRMFVDAREIHQQHHLIQQFDEKRRRLHTLRAREESLRNATQEAERLRKQQSWRAVE